MVYFRMAGAALLMVMICMLVSVLFALSGIRGLVLHVLFGAIIGVIYHHEKMCGVMF